MFWAIWKKTQITDFRLKLSRHRQAIMTLQLALQSEQLSRIAAVADIPPSVRNTIVNSIKFVDVVGTRVLFHIEYCSKWSMFDAFLKARFKDAPFGRLVQEGEYKVSRDAGKTIIRPEEWCRVVQAGMVVEMSIVFEHGEIDRAEKCPICGYLNSNGSCSEGWIDCLGLDCMARLQISKEMVYKDGFCRNQSFKRRYLKSFDHSALELTISPSITVALQCLNGEISGNTRSSTSDTFTSRLRPVMQSHCLTCRLQCPLQMSPSIKVRSAHSSPLRLYVIFYVEPLCDL
ncbi:hypothetical protein BD410DRAFT_552065 [Rickenella mellea]|uniref:Ubiquitin-like domain-containing protein n=1 Tax=Rickenella mellea TaxID=50990 RepID=A0A4Y7PPQ1_9AGAM|nr:hypothetical protein BD410DRAFT_552065 [Rickenella mellea]